MVIERCGLSHRETADFLRVRTDTVAGWSSGRNSVPAGAMEQLRNLYTQIERAADEALRLIGARIVEHDAMGTVELGLASNDQEARSLGWPCVSAQAASLGLVVARSAIEIAIVPRGATMATAAAAEGHVAGRGDRGGGETLG